MAEPGFFGSLFDFNFGCFVTRKLIKAVYVLGMIAGAIGMVLVVLGSFEEQEVFSEVVFGQQGGPSVGIIALVVSPFAYLLYLIVLRVYCEIFLVIFTIAEDLEDIRQGIDKMAGSPPAVP